MNTPCNMHIDKLALEAEKGVNAVGAKGVIFNTITISDGMTPAREGVVTLRAALSFNDLPPAKTASAPDSFRPSAQTDPVDD